MKKIIMMIVLAVLVLSIPVAYSQTVTEWERNVYYEWVERRQHLADDAPKEVRNSIAREVAGEKGLTLDEINAIGDKVWNSDLTQRELEISDDLFDRQSAVPVNTMSKEQSEAAFNRIHREVCNKYGISRAVLDDINMRSMMLYW